MLFALGMSMVSYFILGVVCKNYTYQLATASIFFYLFNELLTILFIFYGLFLIKKENAGYQQSILQQKEEIYANGALLQKQTEELTQLNAFKNRLFSIIAHDLKSPIYALRWCMGMLTVIASRSDLLLLEPLYHHRVKKREDRNGGISFLQS